MRITSAIFLIVLMAMIALFQAKYQAESAILYGKMGLRNALLLDNPKKEYHLISLGKLYFIFDPELGVSKAITDTTRIEVKRYKTLKKGDLYT